jgi:adenosylhomocysteine nucleosidase
LGGAVAIGGGTAKGARHAAQHLAANGVSALVSFGFAGALEPSLQAGDVVLPESVLADNKHLGADPGLTEMLGGPTPHRMLGSKRIISDPIEKQSLWQQTGCAAVDLESGAVAEIAKEYGLPFAVLRAICDSAYRGVPPAAAVALDSEGAVRMRRFVWSVARQPGQVGDLLALAAEAARARSSLIRHLARITR